MLNLFYCMEANALELPRQTRSHFQISTTTASNKSAKYFGQIHVPSQIQTY